MDAEDRKVQQQPVVSRCLPTILPQLNSTGKIAHWKKDRPVTSDGEHLAEVDRNKADHRFHQENRRAKKSIPRSVAAHVLNISLRRGVDDLEDMGMRGLVGGQGEECHVHGWEKIQKEPNTHRNKEPHNCSTTFCGDPITFHLGWCPRHFLRGSKAASLRRKPIVLEYEAEDGPREEKKEGVLLLLSFPLPKTRTRFAASPGPSRTCV
ncbi:hypothetical protein C0Q70_16748 [Pomacea canaliculata]|uniref:Uncharacterized protein n=1 Tax=Pomacea canaliculata TaxID=400727 RepID=A0A2T7NQP2_POMCA|nr:hypothetical protein C0Q70_16748 [Pomacea canaliculata]